MKIKDKKETINPDDLQDRFNSINRKYPSEKQILSIDPGRFSGWSIVHNFDVVISGEFMSKTLAALSWEISNLYNQLATYYPISIKNISILAIEQQFVGNPRSSVNLAQKTGVWIGTFLDSFYRTSTEQLYPSVQVILPKEWGTLYGINSLKSDERKEQTLRLVSDLFPQKNWAGNEAEAVLIGLYAEYQDRLQQP